MELIIKPTEKCNFKCTFCSSTNITDNKDAVLSHDYIFKFLDRYPNTTTIIINGGDPLMVPPDYYWKIIDFLDKKEMNTTLSFTTNLWAFYKNPKKWQSLFTHPRVGVTTSFQYGPGRLKGDLTLFSEKDFWNVSDKMLEYCGYRPDFISVITNENIQYAIDNVRLAKQMNVECKLNYAVSSGPQVKFKSITIGQKGKPLVLADIYEIYVEIWKQNLTPWEYNTKQMVKRLKQYSTTCPQNRDCDSSIRVLQPSGEYYSCGSFGDDREYQINFDEEINQGKKVFPLRFQPELQSLKQSCYICPMFNICNGCRKTIKDMKQNNLVEKHCKKMKSIALDIIKANGLNQEVTPYVDETINII